MNPGQRVFSAAIGRANTFQAGVRRFAKLERVLAALSVLTPAFLILFGDGAMLDSISAYYAMKQSQIFYVPFTVVVMLFVVNGVVKNRNPYNIVLGVALAGLVLFNHKDFNTLHNIFVFIFFAGNAVVILFLSSILKRWWFKAAIIAGIVLLLLGRIFIEPFTTFWLEWASLAIIALHYILESKWGTQDTS